MRASKYLVTFNDIRTELSNKSNTEPPLLKPGVSSYPPSSNKCMSWNDLKNWLLWAEGYDEAQMPTWDDFLSFAHGNAVSGTMYGTDGWGGAWTNWYLSLYTTSPPHTSRATNIDLKTSPGQAAAIVHYKIDGNWWSGAWTHWMFKCKRKSNGAHVYGCFNETRTNASNCSNQTTNGDIERASHTVSPKGCILALVPHGEWIEEVFVADNVSGTDGRVDYYFEWFVIPWPY